MTQLSSRRGTVQLPVRFNAGMRLGMVFVPFHWGDLYGEGNAANYLTISAIGRVAKQPELKFCAVSLEKVRGLNHRGTEAQRRQEANGENENSNGAAGLVRVALRV